MAEQDTENAQQEKQSSDSPWTDQRLEEARKEFAKEKNEYDTKKDFLKEPKANMQRAVQKMEKSLKPYLTAIETLNNAREALQSVKNEQIETSEARLTTASQNLADAEKKFEETEKIFTEANKAFKTKRDTFSRAKHDVFEAATQVNRKAVVLSWWLTVVRTRNFVRKLLSFGLTMQGGGAYAYLTLLGAAYEIAFYRSVHIDILDYAAPTDFLLSGFKLLFTFNSGMLSTFLQYILSLLPSPIISFLGFFSGMLSTFLQYIHSLIPGSIISFLDFFDFNALPIIVLVALCILALSVLLLIVYGIIALLAILPIWGYARGVAYCSAHAERMPVRPILFILFVLIPVTGAAMVGSYHEPKQTVSIVTTHPLQGSDTLVRIGSSSSHTFFRRIDEANASTTLTIPASQIICISETGDSGKGCQSTTAKGTEQNTTSQNIVLSKEDNPWIDELIQALEESVTENGVRQYISQQMNCDKDRLEISEFFRFGRNKAKLDPTEKQKVFTFVDEWKKKWVDQSAQCKVFGFASADGEQTGNNNLSSERVKEVKNLLGGKPNPLCDIIEDGEVMGEDHPINGVANSRSARIAVCAN